MTISPLLRAPAVTTRLLLRTLAIAACLALAAPAWGAADEEPVPLPPTAPTAEAPAAAGEAGEAEAKALIDAGRFADALAILRPLLGEEAVEANALFLYGLAAVGASRHPDVDEDTREALLNEAIGAFHAMLVEAPGLVRVRLELARAFYLKGEDDLARRHFEAVLAGGVPQQVAANVRDFLTAMRARDRWSFSVGAALAPDTNIGAASEERTIYIHVFGEPLPFERNADELTTSGIGVSVWGGAEYQVPLAERWRLRAGGEAARREYSGSKYDQLFLATHLGPRWLVDRDTAASLLASARQRWVGTVPDNRAFGARLEVGRRLSPRVTVSGRASWHDRRYRTESFRDGPIMDASLRGSWVVTPTVRAELSAGYAQERPESVAYRNSSRWLGAGVSVILPLGFTVGGGAEMRWTDFEDEWPPYTPPGEDRADRTRSLRLSVHNRALTLFALKLVAGIAGAVTLMSMLSCAVDRIGSRAAAEAELAMTRAAAAEERRVAGIADRARIEAEAAHRDALVQRERDRTASGAALAAVRAAVDIPRAPGECPARCRLPEALIEALETQAETDR